MVIGFNFHLGHEINNADEAVRVECLTYTARTTPLETTFSAVQFRRNELTTL